MFLTRASEVTLQGPRPRRWAVGLHAVVLDPAGRRDPKAAEGQRRAAAQRHGRDIRDVGDQGARLRPGPCGLVEELRGGHRGRERVPAEDECELLATGGDPGAPVMHARHRHRAADAPGRIEQRGVLDSSVRPVDRDRAVGGPGSDDLAIPRRSRVRIGHAALDGHVRPAGRRLSARDVRRRHSQPRSAARIEELDRVRDDANARDVRAQRDVVDDLLRARAGRKREGLLRARGVRAIHDVSATLVGRRVNEIAVRHLDDRAVRATERDGDGETRRDVAKIEGVARLDVQLHRGRSCGRRRRLCCPVVPKTGMRPPGLRTNAVATPEGRSGMPRLDGSFAPRACAGVAAADTRNESWRCATSCPACAEVGTAGDGEATTGDSFSAGS